jgi:hypothetical protein
MSEDVTVTLSRVTQRIWRRVLHELQIPTSRQVGHGLSGAITVQRDLVRSANSRNIEIGVIIDARVEMCRFIRRVNFSG